MRCHWTIIIFFFSVFGFSLELLAQCPPGLTSRTLVDSGPSGTRYNLVIMGDGFRQAEQGDFDNLVNDLVRDLFQIDVYATHQTAFNIYRVNVVSTDSGIDHPEKNMFVDNALGLAYNNDNIQRCIFPATSADTTAILDAAACAPDHDVILAVS